MRQKETLLDTPLQDKILTVNPLEGFTMEEIGEQHLFTSFETPMRPDAFEIDDETKIELIERRVTVIKNILGLDLNDDSLKGTPPKKTLRCRPSLQPKTSGMSFRCSPDKN